MSRATQTIGAPTVRKGVWYTMPRRDRRYNKEIQRADDDGNGNPDAATWTTIDVVSGQTTRYHDPIFPGGRKHYRHRFVGADCTTDGDWSTPDDAVPAFDVDFGGRTGQDIPRANDDCRKVSDQLGDVVTLDAQESDFDSDGVVEGRLLVTVVGTGLYDIQFETRQGRGTGWTSGALSQDVGNGTTVQQDVALSDKVNSFIAAEVFDAGTNISLGRRVVTFDPDDVAEVQGVSAAIDDSSKNVLVSASGDSDTDSVRVRVALNSDPADPDGTASDDGVISARSGTVDTGVTAGDQDVAHVKARGVNTAGTLGPVKEARVSLASGARLPTVDEAVSESGSTGSLDLSIEDPETRVTAVQFEKKTGSGDWGAVTAFDRSTGTTGSSTTLTRGEDVPLVEKHNVSLRWKVTYTAPDGSSEVLASTVTYDVDNIAEVRTPAVSVDPDDGSLTVHAAGDSDTATMYLTHTTDGSAPADPTSSNQDETISARSGSVTFSGVTVPKGAVARVKVRGENSSGQIAPASTVKEGQAKRRTPVSTVNLLGEDAGPERSDSSGFFYLNRYPIDGLRLEDGATVSLSGELWSDGGDDSVQLRLRFFDASDSVLATHDSTTVNSTTPVRVEVENKSVPTNTRKIEVRVFRGSGDNARARRVMLNRGPIAAPYSDPPDRSSENLLGFDAWAEHSSTSDGWAHRWLQKEPIDNLGLSVGDLVSFTAEKKSDGTRAVDLRIDFWDSSDTNLSTFRTIEGFTTNTSYNRRFIHAVEIPANTASITVGVDNQNTTSGEGFGRRAMLNRGPRAAPFSGPRFAFDRDFLDQLPNSRLLKSGHLAEGMAIEVAGALRQIVRFTQTGEEEDGVGVTFPVSYDDVPEIEVKARNALNYSAGLGGSADQHGVRKPDAADNQGFTPLAELQDRGAVTATVDSYPAGTLTSQGDALSLAGKVEGENGGAGLSDLSVNDTYVSEWNIQATLTDSGSGGGPTASSAEVVVAVDKWDFDVGSWTEVGTKTYNFNAVSGGSESINQNDTKEFTHSGFDSGEDDDVRTRIKSVTTDCGSSGCSFSVTVDPVEVRYDSATVSRDSMSAGGAALPWEARKAL